MLTSSFKELASPLSTLTLAEIPKVLLISTSFKLVTCTVT